MLESSPKSTNLALKRCRITARTLSLRFALLGLCVLIPPQLNSQQQNPLLSSPPKTWIDVAAAKEIDIIDHPGSYIRYRQRSIDEKSDDLRDIIESKDGTVARLIMRNSKPLTTEEDQAERDRLNGLIDHPSDYARHVKSDTSSKKLAIDMIKIMTGAMIYTYAADQTPSSASAAPQVVIDYIPDPHFNPPNTTSVALTGLRGRIWIDANSKVIVHMTGEIFRSVNFGWGVLAHIYPGGKLDIDQSLAVGSRWNMTIFHEDITARALMVKTIAVKKEYRSLDFQPLPGPMGYQDAIRLLLNTPLPK